MKKNYRIAEKVIEISSLHEDVHNYCKDYLTTETPDFSVEITQADIDHEDLKTKREYAYEGLPEPHFSQGLLEITAVYRKIAEQMVQYDTIVFHGSCIAVEGQGYLFTAKSGTGKSTHTRLWRELLGDRAVMVNDDKPMLKITENGVLAYGTPYNGKHRLGENIVVPLKGICILERAETNHIERITKAQAYAMLLQQVYRPPHSEAMHKTLTLIDQLAEQTQLYRLGCNMELTAAETAYNAMKG